MVNAAPTESPTVLPKAPEPSGAGLLAAGSPKPIGPFPFSLLAVLLGIVAGVGAYAFRGLISFFHNLFFLGRISLAYDSNQHTPAGPLGYGVALVPAVGAVIVVFLVKNFAPEAKGHGVPEVMDAIYYKKGVIRPIVAAVKSFASAISIGSGGSVGREGPIIQIGAAFASSTGRLARASRWQLATLVAAGGGAGIAATFNTPIGGGLFAARAPCPPAPPRPSPPRGACRSSRPSRSFPRIWSSAASWPSSPRSSSARSTRPKTSSSGASRIANIFAT